MFVWLVGFSLPHFLLKPLQQASTPTHFCEGQQQLPHSQIQQTLLVHLLLVRTWAHVITFPSSKPFLCLASRTPLVPGILFLHWSLLPVFVGSSSSPWPLNSEVFQASVFEFDLCLHPLPEWSYPGSGLKYYLCAVNSQIYIFSLDLPLNAIHLCPTTYWTSTLRYFIGISSLT